MTTDELIKSLQINRENREAIETKKNQDIIDDEAEAREYTKLGRSDLIKLINQIISRNIIDDMLDDGYIPEIYNGCYGRPGMSKRATILWNLARNELKDISKFQKYGNMAKRFSDRFIEAKVILFLGDKANSKYSVPVFDFVKIEICDFIQINEYDGCESLRFDKNRYVSDTMKVILKDFTINNDEKISKMNSLVDISVVDPIIEFEDVVHREVKELPPFLSIVEYQPDTSK